jgi:NAD(P)-dependent dehydrogenase (short-subunit alcohol dehydrogenase family)
VLRSPTASVDEEGRGMGYELAGKVAVCTGGAQGIGRGTAERFLAEGARVVLADVNREHGEAVARELGADCAFKQTDVSDPAQVQALVDFAVERFGGLHVMFNNAGISGLRRARLFDEDFSDFYQVMGINLLGVMAGTTSAARHMADHGGGSIINITSIGAMRPSASMINYSLSKVGVIMFSQSAAIDLGEYNIRVNCIAPGNIETPILGEAMGQGLSDVEKAAMLAKTREYLINRQPIRRQGKPSDIAEAAVFFASDRSGYITGTLLPVDGGMVTGTPPGSERGIDEMRQEVRTG